MRLCPDCDYLLYDEDAPIDRCPECGTALDPIFFSGTCLLDVKELRAEVSGLMILPIIIALGYLTLWGMVSLASNVFWVLYPTALVLASLIGWLVRRRFFDIKPIWFKPDGIHTRSALNKVIHYQWSHIKSITERPLAVKELDRHQRYVADHPALAALQSGALCWTMTFNRMRLLASLNGNLKLHMLVPETRADELAAAIGHHTGKHFFPKRRPRVLSIGTKTYDTTLDAGSMHHRSPKK